MKASIAGVALIGSLITGQSAPNNNKEVTSGLSHSTTIDHKTLVTRILEAEEMIEKVGDSANSQTGDLFLELVPSSDFGNITKEREAIAILIQDLTNAKMSYGTFMSTSQLSQLHEGITELSTAYSSVGTSDFTRGDFEQNTYDALLKLVILFEAQSLEDFRDILSSQRTTFGNKAYKSPSNNLLTVAGSAQKTAPINMESPIEEYVSLFKMELAYLTYNPTLLASCKKNKEREKLRLMAIVWVQKIIQTAPTNPNEVNSPAHESARNNLFKIRKQLYPLGEMGYIEAQQWGYVELYRQKKKLSLTQKKIGV